MAGKGEIRREREIGEDRESQKLRVHVRCAKFKPEQKIGGGVTRVLVPR